MVRVIETELQAISARLQLHLLNEGLDVFGFVAKEAANHTGGTPLIPGRVAGRCNSVSQQPGTTEAGRARVTIKGRIRLFREAVSEAIREIRGLSEPPLEPMTPQVWMELFTAHADISDDRSAALMWVAMLESALEAALKGRLITNSGLRDDLFGGYGPLSTLRAKIDVGYCVGLYNATTRHDLHVVRRVRNEFAHELGPAAFSQARIAAMCEKMQTERILLEGFSRILAKPEIKRKPGLAESSEARTTFRNAVYTFTLVIGESGKHRLKPILHELNEETRKFLTPFV